MASSGESSVLDPNTRDRVRAALVSVAVGKTIAAVALALLIAPVAVDAQPAQQLYRIGVLFPEAVNPTTLGVLRQGLKDLGIDDGTRVVVLPRAADGDPARLPALARDLVSVPVDMIVAASVQAALAAKSATRQIPIVAVYVFDPVKAGLVSSLARPGGNVTGLSAMATDYVGKMLQVLREVAPRTQRIAVLGDPRNPSYQAYWQELKSLAPDLPLRAYPVRRPEDIASAYSAIAAVPSTALFVMHQPFTWVNRQQIVDLARSNRLIAVYGTRDYVEAGGLLAYGVSIIDAWKRATVYVAKIHGGTSPGDLPFEQPTKFELLINLKTARALRVTIPSSLLLQADQIIE
jgi:putative tryptophan/tyrosine transport system substrate-binding protein